MDKATGSTLARTFEDFGPPDFHPKQTLSKLKAHTFHVGCCCDMIVCCNVLQAFETQLDFEDGCLVCDRVSILMHKFPEDASEATPIEHLLQDYLDCNKVNDKDGLSFDDHFAVETLDSSCEAGNTQEIVDSCTHLMPAQCEDLFELLSKFDVLFNDKLKTFTDKKPS